MSSRARFGILVLILSKDGCMILDGRRRTGFVSFRLLLNVCRSLSARSRIGALRDDSKGESRDGTPKRHPDNAPGQDPYPSRKRDHTNIWKPVCLRRPVRLRLASLAFGEASSGYAGQKSRSLVTQSAVNCPSQRPAGLRS